MNKLWFTLIILYTFGSALETTVTPRDPQYGPSSPAKGQAPSRLGVRIDAGPDLRCITGAAGKNIGADTTGLNVAVIYGFTSGDPNNIMQVKIGYSENRGITWRLFGPFSIHYPNYRRCYSGVDARAGSWPNCEYVYGTWHEAYFRGGAYVDTSPVGVAFWLFPNGPVQTRQMPHSIEGNFWFPCIAVRPDNPDIVYVTAGNYDFGIGGVKSIVGWLSTDGGDTWSDPIHVVDRSSDAPHFRFGTGGYVFAYFQRDTVVGPDTLLWPFYIESTDNGRTWIPPEAKCLFTPSNPPPYPEWSGWWYNYDCEVVNNVPYVVISPGVLGRHLCRTEFWKASGPVGDRTWTMTLLGGSGPPGQDSIVREVSIVTGKDYARFAENIAVISKVTNQSGTSPRCWVSNDLGASWRYLGNLNIPLAAADNPLECAHVPARGTNPLTDVWLHFVYWSGNSVYYDGKNITWAELGRVNGTDGSSVTRPITIYPNPAKKGIWLTKSDNDRLKYLVRIYDVAGTLVMATAIDQGRRGRVDLATLAPGTYFVEMRSRTSRSVDKLIIAR